MIITKYFFVIPLLVGSTAKPDVANTPCRCHHWRTKICAIFQSSKWIIL